MFDAESHGSRIAVITERGERISYAEMSEMANKLLCSIRGRGPVFLLCRNALGAAMGYMSLLKGNIVPFMLQAEMDGAVLNTLAQRFRPQYFWMPCDMAAPAGCTEVIALWGYVLMKTSFDKYPMDDELGQLVYSKGAFGAPRAVRQSRSSIAAGIGISEKYLHLNENSCTITTMPMSSFFGMQVFATHYHLGSTIVLTQKSVLQESFWQQVNQHSVGCMGGISEMYRLLERKGFFQRQSPTLRQLTLAGGSLELRTRRSFARFFGGREGCEFISVFGSAEAGGCMAYVPGSMADAKADCAGIAAPGGKLSLSGADGQPGRVIYESPAVAMGYAADYTDLSAGDTWKGVLETGQMGIFDEDGYLKLTGSVRRSLKLFGTDIGLDDVEDAMLAELGVKAVCTGRENLMLTFVTDKEQIEPALRLLCEKTGLTARMFKIHFIDRIPLALDGRPDYDRLLADYGADTAERTWKKHD